MQDDLIKLRAESKSLKQKLKYETESRKNWQEISRKKEEDIALVKQELMSVTREYDAEKAAHGKTQAGLQLKVERLRIAE